QLALGKGVSRADLDSLREALASGAGVSSGLNSRIKDKVGDKWFNALLEHPLRSRQIQSLRDQPAPGLSASELALGEEYIVDKSLRVSFWKHVAGSVADFTAAPFVRTVGRVYYALNNTD